VLHSLAVQILQRPDWQGSPVELAELFHLAKGNNRGLRCLIFSHQFGFELRLVFGSQAELLRSEVCLTDDKGAVDRGDMEGRADRRGLARVMAQPSEALRASGVR
jgi:hypothetical protein